MPTASNLMGLGMPGPLAQIIGRTPAAVTTAGTTAGTATALAPNSINNLTTASSQTGAILPAIAAGLANLGDMIVCNVTSSTSGVLYPPSGATINGASSLTVAQNKTVISFYYSPTLIFSVLTA